MLNALVLMYAFTVFVPPFFFLFSFLSLILIYAFIVLVLF